MARRHLHEQHDAGVVLPRLTDDHALFDLGHRVDPPVDLRRADPHTARVEGRIGTARNHVPAGLACRDEISVMPQALEPIEVGGVVAGVIGIVPKTQRHRRERCATYQLPLDPDWNRCSIAVDDVDGKAERGHLDLPGVHRQHRVADHQTAAEIGTPGNRRQVKIGLDRVVHEPEPLGRQCRTGRCQRADRAEIMGVSWPDFGVRARVEKLRRRTEEGHPNLVGKIEESVRIRVRRRAVKQHQRRSSRKPGRKPVPHHPAGGREVEHPVAGAEIGMENVFGQVLQQHTTGAVHDALGLAGGARREQHVPRVIERQRHKRDRRRLDVVEPAGLDDDRCTKGWQRRDDLVETTSAVVALAVVGVVRNREQHGRLDLPETIDHAIGPEVR